MAGSDSSPAPCLPGLFGPYRDDTVSLETRRASYRDMIGFVPPRVGARLEVTGALDPVALSLQEQLRDHAMKPGLFHEKTIQLMVFAMMMAELSDAAHLHATAARRAGASWEELQAVITLCAVFRGVPAANRGADILAKVAEKEAGSAQAGV
jgi:4-carboxymuconolactone decarboxylase